MAKQTKPTSLNVYALRSLFTDAAFDGGIADAVANRVSPVDAPHIRRCMAAGLVVAEGRVLVLTDAGRDALRAR